MAPCQEATQQGAVSQMQHDALGQSDGLPKSQMQQRQPKQSLLRAQEAHQEKCQGTQEI